MKKEFKSVAVCCRFGKFLKNPQDIAYVHDIVCFKVLSEELDKLEKDKEWKTYRQQLSDENPSADIDKLSDSALKAVLKSDFELYKAWAGFIADKKKELANLQVNADDFAGLCDTDKAFILLEAHKNMKSVSIEIAGDFTKAVNKYYNSGSLKEAKNLFRAGFAKAVGNEGTYFYGAKIRNSDFSDKDIRRAMSGFCKDPSRPKETVTVDGKKVEKLGNYDFRLSYDNKTASRIASNLFGVILESRADSLDIVSNASTVGIKPAEKPAEKPKRTTKK